MQSFSPKVDLETVTLTLDFSELLDPNEDIEAGKCVMADQHGLDVSTTMLISDLDISTAPLVRARVKGGLGGKTYIFQAFVNTTAGRVLVGMAKLPVQPAAFPQDVN